jgi:hypothetical protein
MNSVVARIMTFGAMTSIVAVLALSTGRTALGAERLQQTGAVSAAHDTAVPATDFSARKKHYRYRYNTFPFAFAPPRYYRGGANPNYGPGTAQLRRQQAQGRCVIDEGYGRWTSCSNQ